MKAIHEWQWIFQRNEQGQDVEVSIAIHEGRAYRRKVNHRTGRVLYATAARVDSVESDWLACDENGVLIVGFMP